MSDRPGQLLVYDDAGNFIGPATILIAPTASVVNGRLKLPGISEGIDGLPANPTASVGLSAVPGAATTFMRSDAAPALDQAITPTWTNPHAFEAEVTITAPGTGDPIFTVHNNVLSGPLVMVDAGQVMVGNSGFANIILDQSGIGGTTFQTRYIDLGDIDGMGNATFLTVSDADERFSFLSGGLERARIGSGLMVGTTTDPGAGIVNVAAGFRVGNAAASGNVLRGNGTNFVSAQLAASDISGLGSAATLNVGTSSGDIPVLGVGGKLASSVIPALAISETFVVASQAAMLALSTAETGDVAVRTDLNKSFILAGANPATLAHWQELLTPTDAVLSVNGQTGVVVLNTSHVSEHASNLYYTNTRADARIAAAVGVSVQGYDATLAALAAFNSNGLLVQTAADTFVSRTITGTANQVSVANGNGVLGNPTLSLPQDIHAGASPQFTGLTLTGNLSAAGVASSLIPSVADTYDLGSSTKLWRKGWLSELDAVLFAQNTVSLIGGWLMATKNEGAIPVGQDVGAGDTSIDFGQAMTANDFVLFRAAGSVEYVQVGSVVSGTRYNVTRNLDLSGANAWPAGSVYAVLGNATNGRIEINANSTPRISLIKQGATYNAQTELVRVGDLNGGWGYGAETYGFAAGEYAAGKAWVSVDPTNGFRIGLHNVINGQWDASGNVTLGQVATDSGNAYWNNSNKRLEFRGGSGGTEVQAYVDTSGELVAGGGAVTLSASDGISLSHGASGVSMIKWGSLAAEHTAIYGETSGGTTFRAIGTNSAIHTLNIYAADFARTAVSLLELRSESIGLRSYAVFYNGGLATHPFTGLLIGAADAPAAMLDVRGTGIFSGAVTLSGGVSGNVAFDTNTLYVDATNNRVGIGNASPGADLDVSRSSASDLMLRVYNSGAGGAKMRFVASDGVEAMHQWTHGGWTAALAGKSNAGNANLNFLSARVRGASDTNSEAGLAASQKMAIFGGGAVVIGPATSPTLSGSIKLQVSGDGIRIETARTPASASATGNAGEICWDASFLYICTATNTWRRVAHATW